MTHNQRTTVLIALLVVLCIYIYPLLPSAHSWGPGPNYRNVSVRTTVNITDAAPEILNITCSPTTITLNAGTTRNLVCNVEIRDFNGGNTINGSNGSGVNSTFYYYLNYSSQNDDNNTHYTNRTCSLNATSGFYVNWTCAFDILYYANNGTWYVNATVLDTYRSKNYTDTDAFTVTIQPLYALNVTPTIDFGDLAVGDTSPVPITANVTNFGNMNINVSVYAFGSDNATAGVGYAMLCQQRNISLASERYSTSSAAFGAMTPVTGSPVIFPAFTVVQQTNDSAQVINTTYWRLHINVTENPFGQCNGTVVFAAEAP